jgi:cell division protein FtsZ
MEDSLKEEVGKDVFRSEDDYYEDLIPKLYKPAVKKVPTMAAAITQTEIEFEVDPAPEPEPAVIPEPEPDEEREPTILDKWKQWLNGFMKDVTE